MEINVNGVSITLTTQQIAKQTNKFKTFKDIKSFEDACEFLGDKGVKHKKIIDELKILGCDLDTIKYEELKTIIEAVNDGWKPNWVDTDEKKWYPYFNMKDRFSFCNTTYDSNDGYSIVGSRLCFKSKELAEYMGRTFLKEYEDLLK